jgi:hypothetical protein
MSFCGTSLRLIEGLSIVPVCKRKFMIPFVF